MSGSRRSANRRMSPSCARGQSEQLRALVIGEHGQRVVGDAGQERGVVPAPSGVDVPHVLEAEVVGDLPGREEGVEAEVAGQEGQAVEGDGVELRAIRDRLFDRVAFASS